MNRIVLGLLLLAPIAANASVLLGNRLISKGDEPRRVRDAAGEPDRVDRLPADHMEIWNYRKGNRRVTVWFVDGKVVQAQEAEPDDAPVPAPRSR